MVKNHFHTSDEMGRKAWCHRSISHVDVSRRNVGSVVYAIAVVVFLLGGFLLAYPLVSGWLFDLNAGKVIMGYDRTVISTDQESVDEQLAEAKSYNRTWVATRADSPAETWSSGPVDDSYDTLLNVNNDGVMGYVEIPVIDVRLPIFHGCAEKDLARGVGHLEESSLPVGGEGTHAALTGHRGLPSAELFSRLDEVEIGDDINIVVMGNSLTYRVFATDVVEPGDVESLIPQPSRDFITLITCTPYAVNSHRLLVHAERVPAQSAVRDVAWKIDPYGVGVGIGLLFVLGAMGMECVRIARRNRHPIGKHSRAVEPFWKRG